MTFVKSRNFRDKYLMPLLQLVIIAFLFVFMFDKECVFLFRNILEKFQVCESYQTIIYNLLIPIKMFCHSPSVIAFLFVTLQIICFTTTIMFVVSIFHKPTLNSDRINREQTSLFVKFIENKNCVYLENQRLLC